MNRLGLSPRATASLLPGALLLALAGCGETAPGDAGAEGVTDGTRRMATRLEARADTVDPRRNRFANSARVEALESMQPPPTGPGRLRYEADLAEQLLYAGRLDEAIARYEDALALARRLSPPDHPPPVDGAPSPSRLEINLLDLLASAHLRVAIRDNCIDEHRVASCTVPVPPEGVHTHPEGARAAAALYRRILEARPDDLGPRWLLNVAQMMLGEHPEDVPERWRIPEGALASEYDIGRFRDVAPSAGADVIGHVGGAVLDDFDGDGDLDVMTSSWGLRDPLRYLRNEGDGRFADGTAGAGLSRLYGGGNLVHADYDNDGDLDVFVLRGGWLAEGWPNSLLRNRGDGTFEDVTGEAGLLEPEYPSQTAAWGDFDNDGRLDLFVGNESFGDARNPTQLFRNEGDGTFTDVAAEVSADVVGVVKGVAWGDVDNDGWPDLYLSRQGAPNVLLMNEARGSGAGRRFVDRTREAGVGEPEHSFPVWFWDYDNDGWLDLFVAGYRMRYGDVAAEYLGQPHGAALPRLYRNRGDGTFQDVTEATRLDRIVFAMGANYGDLDNDGWPDVYAGTGDAYVQALMPNRVFRNAGGREFQDVTTAGGFGILYKGHGVAFGDVDHDGDQDVFQALGGAYEGDRGRAVLFENPGHGNRWITLLLEGVESNRSALGARILVTLETEEGLREIHTLAGSGGSFGSNTLRQEIGLGRAVGIRSVTVRWPTSGRTDTWEEVEMDRAYLAREGEPRLSQVTLPRTALP